MGLLLSYLGRITLAQLIPPFFYFSRDQKTTAPLLPTPVARSAHYLTRAAQLPSPILRSSWLHWCVGLVCQLRIPPLYWTQDHNSVAQIPRCRMEHFNGNSYSPAMWVPHNGCPCNLGEIKTETVAANRIRRCLPILARLLYLACAARKPHNGFAMESASPQSPRRTHPGPIKQSRASPYLFPIAGNPTSVRTQHREPRRGRFFPSSSYGDRVLFKDVRSTTPHDFMVRLGTMVQRVHVNSLPEIQLRRGPQILRGRASARCFRR
jgi:hypothetical protein